jgi:hypothetical protein
MYMTHQIQFSMTSIFNTRARLSQLVRNISMITAIDAAQRLDSRGNPTVQVRVTTVKGIDLIPAVCYSYQKLSTAYQEPFKPLSRLEPPKAITKLLSYAMREIRHIMPKAF